MIQWLIVVALVLASAMYALWALLSPRARLRLLDAVAGKSSQASWVLALRRRALGELAGGCGSCAANGEDGPAAPAAPRKRQ
jgi:hypothetical protein